MVIYNKRQYEHNAVGRFFGATGTNDLGTFGGSSSSFTTTFIPSFYTEYKTVYKTQELDASNIAYTELTHGTEVISPFKMFSKTGDSNLRSILLYPETVEKYPDCVYLLERSPLFGIENPNSIENKMVFFNKGGNIMMFTVSKFYDFTMDTIKTVRIKNSNAHEGITYENLDIPAIKKEYETVKDETDASYSNNTLNYTVDLSNDYNNFKPINKYGNVKDQVYKNTHLGNWSCE